MADSENNNTQKPQENLQQKKNKRNLIIWIVLFLVALIGAVVIGYLYMNTSSEVKVLKEEKQQQKVFFERELDSLMGEHNKVKDEYNTLTDSLDVKDSIIETNAKEIKELLQTKWEYYKVQKKLSQLRKVAQGYLVQIDSLYRVNKQLAIENKEIKSKYRKEQQMSQRLGEEKEALNEMVEKAAILKVYNIDAIGLKTTWFDNEKETDKARRTDKIKICFTVEENELTELGEKVLYFRIADPSGKVITPSDSEAYSFEVDDETLQFTMKEIVNYQGESFRKCIHWNNPNPDENLEEGQYTIDIYSKEGKLSQTYIDLR